MPSDPIQCGYDGADLLNVPRLLCAGVADSAHQRLRLLNRLLNAVNSQSRFRHAVSTLFDQAKRLLDKSVHFFGRSGAALRQAADLGGNNGEAAALGPGLSRFNRSI